MADDRAARTKTCFISGRNNPTIEQDENKVAITKEAIKVTDHHGLVHPRASVIGQDSQISAAVGVGIGVVAGGENDRFAPMSETAPAELCDVGVWRHMRWSKQTVIFIKQDMGTPIVSERIRGSA